jgi:hypothetical protein
LFIGLTDKFSWLIEFVLLLCGVSNALWWYMFNELKRSYNTQAIFAVGLVLSLMGAALHCRRPMPDPEDEDDSDTDSDDEELTKEELLEKIKAEDRELQLLKKLQKKREEERLASVSKGLLKQRKNAVLSENDEGTGNF